MTVDIFLDLAKIIFASIAVGHFIYPDKVGLSQALISFVISIALFFWAWLISPKRKV